MSTPKWVETHVVDVRHRPATCTCGQLLAPSQFKCPHALLATNRFHPTRPVAS